jgi:FMN phosphatase YigB (HAD superfamily)
MTSNSGKVSSGNRPRCSVLITDLDNTLWDWFAIWHASFSALLSGVVAKSGVPEDKLVKEIRQVHQEHRTSEYAFLLQELPSLQRLHPGQDIRAIYDDALHAHRSARKQTASLYAGVVETLTAMKQSQTLLVGYTESMAFYTSDRMRRTKLDELLDFLYSAPDHDLPEGMTPEQLRSLPPEHYELKHTQHRHTPRGELKPSPVLLKKIVEEVQADPSEVVYVGDSLMKDVAMAQDANVTDVWAKYGESHRREEYDLLRRVSHWTDADVEREKKLTRYDVKPSYELNQFSELLSLFQFGRR